MRIEIAYRARNAVARVFKRYDVLPLVISRERGERHDPLALNFQNALVRN